jgi:ABC-type polysaccharide/polyol phosphate transport system ATPase subunit
MSQSAIIVENLSKSFLIGHQSSSGGQYRYTALRDVIGRGFRNLVRMTSDFAHGRQVIQGDEVEEFWALSDVSFEVKQGEVLGIVGRNGSGKSTLLKILSRITEPTRGRVSLRGRVASLLEVGTGFHPELTGRENIFLNGAILGMTKKEIRRRFDEIVAFAEVEKFLDTPVKHYSSGMYVRLAFAVAAHLEPEILIVDEVLAVGDAEFQKKCLGKMDEVSRQHGRTVLLVSHNMDVVLKLCSQAILLDAGRIQARGDAQTVTVGYLSSQSLSSRVIDLSGKTREKQTKGVKVRLLRVAPSDLESTWSFPFGKNLSLDISVDAQAPTTESYLAISLHSVRGFEVASWTNLSDGVMLSMQAGTNTFRITFQDLRLLPGQYSLGIAAGVARDWDHIPDAVQFEVTTSLEAAEIRASHLSGVVAPSAIVSVLD